MKRILLLSLFTLFVSSLALAQLKGNSSKAQPAFLVQSTITSRNSVSKTKVIDFASLLGKREKDVKRVLGKPFKIVAKNKDGDLEWNYKRIGFLRFQVTFDEGKVHNIFAGVNKNKSPEECLSLLGLSPTLWVAKKEEPLHVGYQEHVYKYNRYFLDINCQPDTKTLNIQLSNINDD